MATIFFRQAMSYALPIVWVASASNALSLKSANQPTTPPSSEVCALAHIAKLTASMFEPTDDVWFGSTLDSNTRQSTLEPSPTAALRQASE